MKYLLLSVFLLIGGCQVATYQVGTGDKTQIYTVVRNPDQAFEIFATSKTSQQSGSVSVPITPTATTNVNVSGSNATTSTVVTLAQSLDQVNTQLLGAYKAALFGLNANPTNETNRDQFWQTINLLNQYGVNLRLIALAHETAQASQATTVAKEVRSSKISTDAKAFVAAHKDDTNPEVVRLLPSLMKVVSSPILENIADARINLGSVDESKLTPDVKKAVYQMFADTVVYKSLDQTQQTLQSSLAALSAQVSKPLGK